MDLYIKRDIPDPRAPKIVGFDTELMNVNPAKDDAGFSASRALLREVSGCSANLPGSLQDSGRKFLPGSGGSIYIDLNHLELASPECRSAVDFMTWFHAMLGIAREATQAANHDRLEERKLRVHANNSDGLGNAWGGHVSVMLSDSAYQWIFFERLHLQLYLASAQISSIIFTGAGEVGTEKGRNKVPFSISQRAGFMEVMSSIETTRNRPLVNTRDERLAGVGLSRLHCIFHDTTLTHTSLVMKAGLMQIFLASIEAGRDDPGLCFEEPLVALRTFNTDPSLQAKARLLNGQQVTAVEHQMLLLEGATKLLDGGGEAYIPGLAELLALWERLLQAFRDEDRDFLFPRVDWIAKHAVLNRAASARGLAFSEPSMKALDFAWSDLENGIYFDLERSKSVERLASQHHIAHAEKSAPADTRAYPRSRLIRAFGGRGGVSIDWHRVVVGRGNRKRAVVRLPDPGAGRQQFGDLDGLTEHELAATLGVTIEPDKWFFSVLNTR
ncbi:proteasome accessory factor PafA2 family protein [Haloferula sp. A504]|uniref:proteasome accessory factor PafA2 family protein n=1 Tax=Haloferula sp. A504 TaxID=3373601 RepID=UPI0031C49E36|nr:proteasome accessory factor PafA2 family protein [Verrucomicrobiaceae bacterium E54]